MKCNNAMIDKVNDNTHVMECHVCGNIENQTKGGLVSEIYLKARGSEAYKIILNEFTRQDPTLPHLKTMKCPSAACNSNTSGADKDVIYLKYDAENLKFLYICNVCDTHWRSRS